MCPGHLSLLWLMTGLPPSICSYLRVTPGPGDVRAPLTRGARHSLGAGSLWEKGLERLKTEMGSGTKLREGRKGRGRGQGLAHLIFAPAPSKTLAFRKHRNRGRSRGTANILFCLRNGNGSLEGV